MSAGPIQGLDTTSTGAPSAGAPRFVKVASDGSIEAPVPAIKTLAAISVGAASASKIVAVATPCVRGVLLQADSGNGSAYVCIGDSTVTAANGLQLAAGASVTLTVSDASIIYAISSSGSITLRAMVL